MNTKAKVLVVDDVPKNVRLLEAYLVAAKYAVDSAYSGEEMLERVKVAPPDLILLDVMMPGMDGFEVCNILKSDEKTRLIPIVMVTALDTMEDKVHGIEMGADDFLTKPVNKHELLAKASTLVKNKKLNDRILRFQEQLKSLIEISTFTKRYSDREVLLRDFASGVAELTQGESVAITFAKGAEQAMEMDFQLSDDIRRICFDEHNISEQIVSKGEILVLQKEAFNESFGINKNYLGVPLVDIDGVPTGAIHAFGCEDDMQDEVVRLVTIAAQRLSYELRLKDYNQRLEHEVELRTSELSRALIEIKRTNDGLIKAQTETIFRLARAAEYRDEDTAAHINRMSNYSHTIAMRMNLDPIFCDLIKISSIMHDVGKIGVPDHILLKPGKLTPEEYEIIKEHTLIGYKILEGSESEVLKMSSRIALYHHEKWNGKGYPYGLKSTDIPLEARITAMADVFDALTTKRVYKPAFAVETAISMIQKDTGTHFDPQVSEAFMGAMEEILQIKQRFTEEAYEVIGLQ